MGSGCKTPPTSIQLGEVSHPLNHPAPKYPYQAGFCIEEVFTGVMNPATDSSISAGSFSTSGGQAVSDTGTSFIAGPKSAIAGIAQAVGAQLMGDSYIISCHAKPADVVLTIGTNQYHINYKNYITKVQRKSCSILHFFFSHFAHFSYA
jgi:hypothetical protein